MASTYSTSLRLELMGTGDQSGTWGTTTNTNLGTLLEQAITGFLSVAQGDVADMTLTTVNGGVDQARNAIIDFTGALTAARNVVVPTVEKLYLIKNSTSGGFALTVKTSAGSGVSIANGSSQWVYCDGTNVVQGLSGTMAAMAASAVAITGGTIAGLTTLTMASGAATPATNDAAALGTTSLSWSDLCLASGAVINIANGNWVATHTSGILTVGTGDLRVTTAGTNAASVVTVGGTQTLTNKTMSGGTLSGVSTTGTTTLGGALAGADQEAGRLKLVDYAETVNPLGAGGGTRTVNMELGNVATLTVSTSANTLSITNPPATGIAGSLTLIITNGGSQTFNWPSGTTWASGSEPTLTTSGVDIITMLTIDAGTTWRGFVGGLAFS